MDEYISRSEAEHHIVGRLLETALNNVSINIEACQVYSDAADRLRDCWLKEIPAADVKPVLKGKWVPLEPEIGLYGCSCCKHRILKARCNFCPNCGSYNGGDTE